MIRSISFRFTVILVATLALVQGLGTWVYVQSAKSALLDALHDRMDRTLGQAVEVCTEPLWNSDFHTVGPYAATVIRDPDISHLRVLDSLGNAVVNLAGAGPGQFRRVQPVTLEGQTIGSVELGYGARSVERGMLKSLFFIPASQAAALLLGAAVLLALFRVYVRRPVAELVDTLEQITEGNLAVDLGRPGTSELGAIARGIEFLRQRLDRTVGQATAISRAVASVTSSLNRLFEELRGASDRQNEATGQVSVALSTAEGLHTSVLERADAMATLSRENTTALGSLRQRSEQIANSAETLTEDLAGSHATLTQLAQSARQIVHMAGEVTRAVEETSASVQQNSASLRSVEEVLKESSSITAEVANAISGPGLQAASTAMDRLGRIERFFSEFTHVIDRLDRRSSDIDRALHLIVDVTDKIKLLSLNAQIIAAQAGEQGKGFSVVAEEMQRLSEKSAGSSREIGVTVEEIQREIQEVVDGAKEAGDLVEGARESVAAAESVQTRILASSERASDLARHIEAAILEQSHGLEIVAASGLEITNRVFEVTVAAQQQEAGTGSLLETMGAIKLAMDDTRARTEEQAASAGVLQSNLESADGSVQEIVRASTEQARLGREIQQAVEEIRASGQSTSRYVARLPEMLQRLRTNVDELSSTMEVFTTSADALALSETLSGEDGRSAGPGPQTEAPATPSPSDGGSTSPERDRLTACS